MAEINFTKYFKKNLCDVLNRIFKENEIPLVAKCEFKIFSPSYGEKSFLDIGIVYTYEENSEKPSRLLGIEIEVISGENQIVKNYDKFRDYIFQRNKGRGQGKTVGGLFHLIFDFANIREKQIIELIKHSLLSNQKRYFFYNMYLHDIEDLREYKQLAENFLDKQDGDWKFRSKLIALLELIFEDEFDI
jgi:hypothetical protein